MQMHTTVQYLRCADRISLCVNQPFIYTELVIYPETREITYEISTSEFQNRVRFNGPR